MKTETRGETLFISGLDRLSGINATLFKETILARLESIHQTVEVDLSQVTFIDSMGLGVLIAVQKRMVERKGRLRLLRPVSMVHQMLVLLHLDRVFDIVSD